MVDKKAQYTYAVLLSMKTNIDKIFILWIFSLPKSSVVNLYEITAFLCIVL